MDDLEKTIGHLSYAASSFVHHSVAIQFNSIQYRLLSHNKYIYKYSKKIRKGT